MTRVYLEPMFSGEDHGDGLIRHLNHQADGRKSRWRAVALTAVAGAAGWYDVVRRVATAFSDWGDMILRQALRTFTAVGTAIPIGRLDRQPLLTGQGRGETMLAGKSPLLVVPLPLSDVINVLRYPCPYHFSMAFSVLLTPPFRIGEALLAFTSIVSLTVKALIFLVAQAVLTGPRRYLFPMFLRISLLHLLTLFRVAFRPIEFTLYLCKSVALTLQRSRPVPIYLHTLAETVRIFIVPPTLVAGTTETPPAMRTLAATLSANNQSHTRSFYHEIVS